ncbi:doublecortin domain-containing protein 2C [Saccopteryx leptura]|uniref:doublecortin domain-containing protein 2C n=1 Tax=Saccopteryx leptura TaxID=249018 RepID=UPI00339BE1FB
MGTRGPYLLVDTTPAKTILVYRNGDRFFVGRKFVLGRRRVATFEALLEQLTQEVETPFGVRRLYTPTGGTPVLGLDTLQTGGKYVAAGPERFKRLDYFNIAHRKPEKTRKLKKVKPVVHCNIDVPSRWQTLQHQSRHINVFTNGKVFIAPVKIVIPKFSLMEWSNVLTRVGEKVFPFGGVRKLFTMDGHLLDSSQDLHDNHFYVAVGLENFKSFPYWKYTRVPAKVQQMHADTRKSSPKKKKVTSQGKEPHRDDLIPLEPRDSVFYAKEGKKKRPAEPLGHTGAEGDMYKAQTPNMKTQGALEVREDQDVQVEMTEDQVLVNMVREDEEISDNSPDFESSRHVQFLGHVTEPPTLPTPGVPGLGALLQGGRPWVGSFLPDPCRP